MQEKDLAHISEEHVGLRAEMEAIEAELARLREGGPAVSVDALDHGLRELRDHLRRHFLDEEQSGMFGAPRDLDPTTRMRVEKLLIQHREFLADLDRITSELAQGPATTASIDACAQALDHLFANLRWHDAVETGLLAHFGSRPS